MKPKAARPIPPASCPARPLAHRQRPSFARRRPAVHSPFCSSRQMRPLSAPPPALAGRQPTAHERQRARFPSRSPENTGPSKLSARKSPRPSPPSALICSVDPSTHGDCSRSRTGTGLGPAPQHRSSHHQQHRSRSSLTAQIADSRQIARITDFPKIGTPFGDLRFSGKQVDSQL